MADFSTANATNSPFAVVDCQRLFDFPFASDNQTSKPQGRHYGIITDFHPNPHPDIGAIPFGEFGFSKHFALSCPLLGLWDPCSALNTIESMEQSYSKVGGAVCRA